MEILLSNDMTTDEMYNRQLADPTAIATHMELLDRKLWLGEIDESVLDTISRWLLIWNAEDKGKPIEERKPIKIFIYS